MKERVMTGLLWHEFLDELEPKLIDIVQFDPEADMFCAYSDDKEALKTFIIAFKTPVKMKL